MSLRFWTFFLAFFGLTGLVLDGLNLLPMLPALVAALALGASSGTGMSYAIHKLKQQQVGVVSGPTDFIGREATVLLRVGPGHMGKVRLAMQRGAIELLAEGDEEIRRGETVLVYEMEGTVARVARAFPDEQSPRGQLPPAQG